MLIRSRLLWASWPALTLAVPAWPQEPSVSTVLDPVTVTAQRTRESAFDVPAAIGVVTREAIEQGAAQVNLSEVLHRLPGITVLNRQNYAQDLQLSIRGFGSRSTFGIRGVRLIVDGIPATMPDGQGQASNVSLASAGRIEVLRGPMAQLYGNAAGGVVQVFTQDDAARPTAGVSAALGAYGQRKLGLKFSTSTAEQGFTLDASRFRTDGYRDHSAAERGQLNARWQRHFSGDTRVSVVLNALDQPDTQDPLGLTRAQWEANPEQVVSAAITQNTRKTVRQNQIGSVLEHRLGDDTHFTGRVYAGERNLFNALGIPRMFQEPETHSGGIVRFGRAYAGLGAQLTHRLALGEGRTLRLTGGIDYDRMRDNREGYINDGGEPGALKRHERNVVDNRDAYAQASLAFHPQWTLTGGLRSVDVRFRTQDYFVVGTNPDDTGSVRYQGVNPVLGLTWHATPALNVYANAGRGLETPTFNELAYRPAGLTGLNTELQASRSRHAEVGAKWKPGATQRLDVAAFEIDTHDEIVVASNTGGRSVFRNGGRTERRGVELSHVAQLSDAWRSTLSLTLLRARFENGLRLPGAPERQAYAELAWAPRAAWGGFHAAAELVHTGALAVNDANSEAAPAATVLNLRAGLAQQVGGWRYTQLLRVDNTTDRRYAGSVIVNDSNQRYYEPALPRHWMLAVTASHAF